MAQLTTLSLYSGIGGFEIGGAGLINTTAAYEIDPAACAIYEKLTGLAPTQADLTRINPHTLPDADLIVGGPPCQDFSQAGLNAGKDGANNLWPTTIQIVVAKRPTLFVFENVRGFTQGKHKPYFESVLADFRALGYTTGWKLLNAADCGVPQTRERVFIVGRRDGLPICWPEPSRWNKPTGMFYSRWVSWYDALRDWLKDAEIYPKGLPRWLLALNAYRSGAPDGLYSGNRNGGKGNRQHRRPDEPAFTIIKSANRAPTRIKIGETVYLLNERGRSILQCLPYTAGLTAEMTGNAIPPH